MAKKKLISLCEKPIVIVSKSAIRHIIRCGFFIAQGVQIHLTSADVSNLIKHGKCCKLNYYLSKIANDNELLYEFLVPDTFGTPIFVYQLVGCGKCLYCRNKKAKEWQIRCMAETITSISEPISVLLTYDNEHVHPYGLEPKDVQLFFKRLRITLKRTLPYYKDNLRYFMVGEYGKKRRRPHYHLLLWNFPQFHLEPNLNLYKVNEFIQSCWQQGFSSTRYTENVSGNKDTTRATKYYVKYLYKDCDIPYYREYIYDEDMQDVVCEFLQCRKPFMRCSRGCAANGTYGLGSEWLERNKSAIMANKGYQDLYKWSYGGVEIQGKLPSYFLRRLLPTISQAIPKIVRDSYLYFRTIEPYLITHDYKFDFGENNNVYDYINTLRNKFWMLDEINALDIDYFIGRSKVEYTEAYLSKYMISVLHMLENYTIPYEKVLLAVRDKPEYDNKVANDLLNRLVEDVDSNYHTIKYNIQPNNRINVQDDEQ